VKEEDEEVGMWRRRHRWEGRWRKMRRCKCEKR
jgi:hypothetical protein